MITEKLLKLVFFLAATRGASCLLLKTSTVDLCNLLKYFPDGFMVSEH